MTIRDARQSDPTIVCRPTATSSGLKSTHRAELDEHTRSLFDEGRAALEASRLEDAVSLLRRANELAPRHAGIRSSFGLALALGEDDFEAARALCEEAARQEFFDPAHSLAIARVYLHFGRKAEALRYLRRGAMIAPGHPLLVDALAGLGRRRSPVLPFLPRRHVVNRVLGAARSRVSAALSRA